MIVILVEDSETERALLRAQLNLANIDVIEFDNAEDALNFVSSNKAGEVVISDAILDSKSLASEFSHLNKLSKFRPTVCYTAAESLLTPFDFPNIPIVSKERGASYLISAVIKSLSPAS